MKPARNISLVRGMFIMLAATFGQTAWAASLTFNNFANPDEIRVNVGQFEGGFSVNGLQIQSPGLGTGSTTVLETDNSCVMTYSGTWIDLGDAALGNRTIYFVDPADNTLVTDILVVNYTDGGSGAIISGTWTSNGCGSLGAIPGGTAPEDIVVADGTTVTFSNAFISAQALAGTSTLGVGAASFYVTKTFSDGNDAEVDVTLTCNTGNPLEQDFTIEGGGDGVLFVVENIQAGATCSVTESGGPAGYTAVFNGGAGCTWEGVTGGLRNCAITNEADPAEFTVTKEWIVSGAVGEEVIEAAEVSIFCNNSIQGGYWNGSEYQYNAFLEGDGDSVTVSVDTTTRSAQCRAVEDVLQSGVESEDNCGTRTIPAGGSSSCTITNTVFFEGIPTLSQWGMALMALLMLGVGFIGLRRIA